MPGKALVQPTIEISALLDHEGRNRAAEIMELFLDLCGLLSGHLTDQHIEDGAVITALLAAKAVTRPKLGDDVDRMAQGRYTGDDTANRVISVADSQGGFTPTEVIVLAVTDLNEFHSRDDGTAVVSWWRTSLGAMSSGATDWQGIVAGGFECGSALANLSNKSAQAYTWVAWKRG